MKYKGRTVMVIDSKPSHREEICRELEDLEFDRADMICVDNVGEGNEILEAGQHVDMIFLEVKGSDAPDGYSVCSFVKLARERYDIPVFLTFIGSLGPFRDASVYSQGFVEKPIDKIDLGEKVNRVMRITILEEKVDALCVPDENEGDCCDG